jgi:hypothetical protein
MKLLSFPVWTREHNFLVDGYIRRAEHTAALDACGGGV